MASVFSFFNPHNEAIFDDRLRVPTMGFGVMWAFKVDEAVGRIGALLEWSGLKDGDFVPRHYGVFESFLGFEVFRCVHDHLPLNTTTPVKTVHTHVSSSMIMVGVGMWVIVDGKMEPQKEPHRITRMVVRKNVRIKLPLIKIGEQHRALCHSPELFNGRLWWSLLRRVFRSWRLF